jgi:hypothetical protein
VKPGRELDALVAEKVFGIDVNAETDEVDWDDGPNFPNFYKQKVRIAPYSTDIAAAWEVVERLMQMENKIDVEQSEYSGSITGKKQREWKCRLNWGGWIGKQQIISWGESAPHSICLSALKLVGAL